MKLVIEEQKILNYLLKKLEKQDKSNFLKLIGYNKKNWEKLRDDIITQFSKYTIETYEQNDYGALYKIEGKLKGPLKTVDLITVWIQQADTDNLKLVTLFPNKKQL